MPGLRSLIWKEWRDLRAITVGAAIVAFWATVWLQASWLHHMDPHATAQLLIPGLVALFVAVVGSDLIARDVTTRRIDTLALLPIRIADVWTAKVVVATLLCTAFTVWVVLCQLFNVGLFETARLPKHVFALSEAIAPLALVFLLGGVVTFFSTILERGFATVLAAVALIGGVGFVLTWVDLPFHGLALSPGGSAIMLAIAGGAFLFGSRRGFVRGPIHQGAALRVATAAGLGAFAILAPVTLAEAALWRARVSISPGGSEVRLHQIDVSPDGRYAVLTGSDPELFADVRCERPDDIGEPEGTVDYAERVWWIDLSTGELREVPERASSLVAGDGRWTSSGQLRILTHTGSRVPPIWGLPVRVLDLDTGQTKAVAWSAPSNRRGLNCHAVRKRSKRRRGVRRRSNAPAVRNSANGKLQYQIVWRERDIVHHVEAAYARRCPGASVVELHDGDGHVTLFDVATGTRWEGVTDGQELVTICRAYSAVVLRENGETRVEDAWTGDVIAGPWAAPLVDAGVEHRLPAQYVVLEDEQRDTIVVLDLDAGGREVQAIPLAGRSYDLLAGRAPGTFVLANRGHDGDAIVDLIEKDGSLRRLYPPQEVE